MLSFLESLSLMNQVKSIDFITQYLIINMEQSQIKQQEKLTLTQLQRYLPLLPPKASFQFPQGVKRYLGSSSFNNFSLKEQSKIKQSLQIAYRNYYAINEIVNHLSQLTNNCFTRESIEQGVCNCASKYQLIDWFLFVRIVRGHKKVHKKLTQNEAVSLIMAQYRKFQSKKKIENGRQEVQLLKRSLDEKLVRQFGKQAFSQIKQLIDRNRYQMEQRYAQSNFEDKVNYIRLDQLVNRVLQCSLEPKKMKYLYLRYDYKNVGWFNLKQFTSQIFTQKKVISVPKQLYFLKGVDQLFQFVRKYTKQMYYSSQQLLTAYTNEYHNKTINSEQKDELHPYQLYLFLRDKCQNKLSYLQVTNIYACLKFVNQIVMLYDKKSASDLADEADKLSMKKQRRKVMKKQNQVYYSYRKILLVLISKCRSKKLTRQELNHAVVAYDPSLKYNSFYCVWRVYGGLINLDRIKAESGLNPLACLFKLSYNDEQYQKIVEKLLEQYPSGTEVAYSKVQQKINLQNQFVLETQQLKPLPYGEYDPVDYRKCISQILPFDFEIKLRSYIFKKVSEKIIVLWRNIRTKRRQRQNRQILQALLSKTMADKQKKEKQVTKQKTVSGRRLTNNKSIASLASKASGKSKKEINPQHLELVIQLLEEIFENLKINQLTNTLSGQSNDCYKMEIALACKQTYTFRSILTRTCYHPLIGGLSRSKDFLQLSEGRQTHLDIKIPYKPGVEIIDFTVWNNSLTVFTSYNTLQIYSLGQSNNYPIRSVQFQLSPISIDNSQYDRICNNRFYGTYPITIKVSRNQLLVSLMHSKQIYFVDEDPTIETKKLSLTFADHFYPKQLLKWFQVLKKRAGGQVIKFIQGLVKIADAFKASYSHSCVKEFAQLLRQSQIINEQISQFQIKEVFLFCCEYSSPILRTILRRECGLKQKLGIPNELIVIVKLVIEYMRQNNFSLHEMIQEITYMTEEVGLRQFKNYLMRVAYEQFLQFQKEIDRYLKTLARNKTIDYSVLADLLGNTWPYSLMEKPFFIINDLAFLEEYRLIFYTLNGSSTIFIRNVDSGDLVAKLIGHKSTPVFHLIESSLILISADAVKVRGQTIDLHVWRLQQDLFDRFTQRPPWIITSYYQLKAVHDQPVTSLIYLQRSNTIASTSLDSTLKIWRIQKPLALSQLRRIYSNQHLYISAQSYVIKLEEEISMQYLVAAKINKQISSNNIYRYESTVQIFIVQTVQARAASQCKHLQTPLKVQQAMLRQGQNLAVRKKALLSKSNYNKIQFLNRGALMLESLDRNIYNSLKNAYIFQNYRQLTLLSTFLKRSEHAQIVVRKVCEDYGLNILAQSESLEILEAPPNLSQIQQASKLEEIQFSSDLFEQIWDKMMKNSTNHQTLIQADILRKLMAPYLFGDNEAKFEGILVQSAYQKNNKLIEINKLKQFIRTYEIDGQIPKFYSSLRSLIHFLKERKIQLWELFSITKQELQRCKKVRKVDFVAFIQETGFSKIKLENIINFLNRSGTISLFQFLHYVRIAIQQANQSALMPNYSSLLISQSQIQISQVMIDKQKIQKQDSISLSKSCLQQQIQQMINRKSSKLSSISESQQKQRVHSAQKGSRNLIEDDNRPNLAVSTSRGSLSKDITYTKDTVKREAIGIMRSFQELLRNEGKSLWQLLALATPDFISSPIISETQYFIIYDYLKTPFKLKQKLKLLKYVKRQSNGIVDLNIIFELMENANISKNKSQGQKYLVSYILQKLEELSPNFDHAIQIAFYLQQAEKQMEVDALTLTISRPPFNCSHFALKQFEQILLEQKKLRFALSDLKIIFTTVVQRHKLKIQFNKLNFLAALRFRLQKKGQSLRQIFPKGISVDLSYFIERAGEMHPEPSHLERDFHNIVNSISKHNKSSVLRWDDFIKELQKKLGNFNEETNRELQASRKFIKQLQGRRMTVLQFFLGLDRSRKYYVTQQQLQSGMAQLNVTYDLWINIKKKYSKRLYYLQLIQFLQENRILNYKTVDSQVQIAMQKFTRRYLRNQDVEAAFIRIKGDNQKSHIAYDDFRRALKMVNYFSQEEVILLFGLFARQGIVKQSRDGNEQLLRDPNNLKLTIGYKKFADVIGVYRAQNITKSVAFRFYDYLKKRNISFLFQYRKWLERNKKNKEVAQALKKDKTSLSRETFLLFIGEIKGGLNEKQQTELLNRQGQQIDFQIFLGELQRIYKKGTLDLQKEQAEHYLRQLLRKINGMEVTLERLFNDFAQKGNLTLAQLNELSAYVQLGFNKIQLKKLFTYLDKEKRGIISIGQILQGAESIRQQLERDSQDYRFDYIIQKLMLNPQKFVLKSSKVTFNVDRARIIFNSILNPQQAQKLFLQCLKDLKKETITEQQLQQFVKRKSFELKMRFDKKDRELIAKILVFFKKMGIQIEQAFSYLSRQNSRQQIKKQQFVLLMQTFELKCDLSDINSLFSHLQQGRRGMVSRAKWQQKLQLVQLEQQIQTGVQSEDLRLFYKVKLFLAEVYLIFVRKSYKQNQIYHFFDQHSTGRLSPSQLMRSFAELGVTPEEDFARKIVNYLDRTRQGTIHVTFLVQQLQHCLSSKMRLVLHTKTSRLFQEKAKIFQEKANYFIEELSLRQELVEVGGAIKSCILQYNFIDLMRYFGCPFNEDEAQDVRRNFHATEGYLFLYPIYLAFSSLFKESGSSLKEGEADRLKKLFLAMIKHNYSLEELQRFNTHEQLYNFIEQIANFTPVDIKLIINSCSYEGSRTIDVEILRNKIRNVFLSQENQVLSQSFVAFSGNTHEDTLRQLRQKIDLQLFFKTCGSDKGFIDLQAFEDILNKMGVGLTKGNAKRYFELFSEGKDRLDISKLKIIENKQQGEQMQKSVMFKSMMSIKSEQSNQTDKFQHLSLPDIIISQHIAKSLAFKETTLNKQLGKYYQTNFGFISYSQFLLFLTDIGVDLQKNKKQIQSFLQKYSLIFNHASFQKNLLIKVQNLQSLILQSVKQLVQLTLSDGLEEYKIESPIISSWIQNTVISQQEIYNWIKEEQNAEFSIQQLFRFLCKKQGRRLKILEQFIRTIPQFIDTYELFLAWFSGKQKTLKQSSQDQRSMISTMAEKDYFKIFMSRNPIINFSRAIDKFCSIKLGPNAENSNLQRISAILLYQQTISHKYILEVSPCLIFPQCQVQQVQIKIANFENNLPVKNLGSLTIDEQKQIDPCGLLLINEKYYGFPNNFKQQFQNMVMVACKLDPQSIFLKTKNFYLWQPNSQIMPKGGLNYRWSFIPSFARQILTQLSKVHEIGFCFPHLRWKNINKAKGIEKTLYPCSIDKKGLMKQKLGWKSLNYEDPYCCPQFLRGNEQNFNFKCDSWIFGCILYQFIYGHPPQSFISQIQRFTQECKEKYSISQLLQMQELPSTFSYQFYNQQLIKQLFCLQHQFKPNYNIQNLIQTVKREQSLKGLLCCLQISFADDYRYFKQQFHLMQQLNNVIYDCLNPNPSSRPSIESILKRQVFAQVKNIQLYKAVLVNHANAPQFYHQIVEPIFDVAKSFKKQIKNHVILQSLKTLQDNLDFLVNSKQISQELIIPKYYPWPTSTKGVYSQSLLKNKQIIRRTNNFNILTLLFNSYYFDLIIFLVFVSQAKQQEEIFQAILDIFTRLLLTFKEYKSASCGFVHILLDSLLKIMYKQPLTLIDRNWLQMIQLPQPVKEKLSKLYKQHHNRTYLRPHHFKSKHSQRALRILQQICYLTGQGNIEYLPIRHYLLQNEPIQQFIELVHSHVKLVYGQDTLMMINYFRDRMDNERKFYLQLIAKIQIDLMRYLSVRNEAKTNTLIYYRDLLNLYPNRVGLFKYPLIYMQFSALLRDPLESLANKAILLQIIASIIDYPNLSKKIGDPSVNLIGQLVRLMIEPAKNHASHQEYQQLQPYLYKIAKGIDSSEWGKQIIQMVEGGSAVVESLVQKYEKKIELGTSSIIINT